MKGIITIAGYGTRFLPATKSVAKEMLSIVDKPLIQYGAEEAIEAGINKLIFIVGRTKNSIIDHFDKSYELETELEIRGKERLLKIVKDVIPDGVACIFIRQSEALGLGHAVLCAEPAVGSEPFAVILPDDLIRNEGDGCVKQMVQVFDEYQSSIIGTQTVAIEESDKYGMVAGPKLSESLSRVDDIVEKPAPAEAPVQPAPGKFPPATAPATRPGPRTQQAVSPLELIGVTTVRQEHGFDGTGVVVGHIDTGADGSHPAVQVQMGLYGAVSRDSAGGGEAVRAARAA